MNKKVEILIACGSGIATSTMAADEISELCEALNIPFHIQKSSMTEIEGYLNQVDVVFTTNNYSGEILKPHKNITGLITGIKEDEIKEELKELLSNISAEK
ncbi:PTS sugar transporter subunit IIB [Enterococcus pallens]|uniref:PTS EIIB type-2 domain-containing protein n=1 Tax=Enterococcus pallens ATCC BAA-351 TaxID=1158607 RepID=R2QK61_9ENTE|nr:PTS sugar transporter subunit IIB [Enterococcus pallens]EOH95573.1 hypothetical protein UAU_01535 [Enterococcus pallens ATCC BAA-351]EOU21290.1 hypothetical protein I588_02137 [Enterococcus pallens ATCC BAA-351]